ncbi:MAG: D-aminopeptidase [Haliscomenobacter sp.]|nr:D-aminopeptidase [Haliscomenobacter sp.]
MKTLLLSLLVFFSAAACEKDILIPRPELEAGADYSSHPKHAQYQAQLDAYRRNSNSPGAILLVARKNEPIWAGASGKANLEHQSPMQTNTPFRVGSITKMMVSAAILQLVERGQLRLEDPLEDLLPQVRGEIPQAGRITLRHLLSHLSGIFDPPNESKRYQLDLADNPEAMADKTIPQRLEEYVYGKPLHFEPGTAYAYSNANFWLLGMILESQTGKSAPEALQERIFAPLGMTHTYLEKRDDPNVARGYADIYGDGKLLDVSRWDRADTDGDPAGGVISTAADLMRFLRGLMEGLLLGPSYLELMKQIQLETCDNIFCEYGLGIEIWRIGADGIGYGHNGGAVGIEANAIYLPATGNLVVLYKNNGNGSDKSFLDGLLK